MHKISPPCLPHHELNKDNNNRHEKMDRDRGGERNFRTKTAGIKDREN